MKRGRLAASLVATCLTFAVVASPVGAHAKPRAPLLSHPKGRPPVIGAQDARSRSDVHSAATTYMYVSGFQRAAATGASVALRQSQPAVSVDDFHSLAELAVQSADGQQIVEVGWTVDPGLNGDTLPHLFVFHWVDNVPACYNGCGFVQVSNTVHPGDALAGGAMGKFKITFAKNKWWVSYNRQKVGYFPASLWQGRYTQSGLVQAFGEVAVASASPCTDMGNGIFGSATQSSTISKFGLVGSASPSSLSVFSTSPALYDHGAVKPVSFRFGGPGGC